MAAAAGITLTELADHPAAASSARLLRRLGATWTATAAGPDLRPVLGQLAGAAASRALPDIMAAAAARGFAITATAGGRPLSAEPSDDGFATADALLSADGGDGGDVLEAAARAGRRRRAAQLMDVVRLGGAVTGPLAAQADPFDAPLLDGLALMRAVGAIPPFRF